MSMKSTMDVNLTTFDTCFLTSLERIWEVACLHKPHKLCNPNFFTEACSLKCDVCDAALSIYFYGIYARINLQLLLVSFISTDSWYIHSFYELCAELNVTLR